MVLSTAGMYLNKNMLKPNASSKKRKISSVVCHNVVMSASGLQSSAMPCTIPVMICAQAGMPDTHARKAHQPTR
jgi:hypothetical protein